MEKQTSMHAGSAGGLRLHSVEDCRLHNYKAPICKLSDDVLSYIFMLNTQQDDKRPHIPSTVTRRSSQVIKRWRDIALNYSMLWASSLDFADTLPWIREVIARSGASPVTLVFPPVLNFSIGGEYINDPRRQRMALSSRMEDYGERFELAVSLCSRARHITLSFSDAFPHKGQPRWESAIKNLTKTSPYLETFTLRSTFPFGSDKGYVLPANLFDKHAPRLRSLSLISSKCQVKPNPEAFRNLSTLHISHLSPGQSVAEWLRVISGTPELSILTLDSAFSEGKMRMPVGTSTNDYDLVNVALPKLRMLTLKGDYKSCNTCLMQLEFPPSCAIELLFLGGEEGKAYHTMMKNVQHRISVFNVPDWRERGVSIECNLTGFAISNIHQSQGRPTFSFRWYASDFASAGMSSSFLNTPCHAVSDVTDLHFDGDGQYASEVLRIFDKVENLRISQPSVLPVLLKAHKDTSGATSTMLLPSLHQLFFYNLLFSDGLRSPTTQDLEGLIYLRFDIGRPITSITFRRCEGIKEFISDLEILGVEVHWDGWDG